jgi:alginate O-acetyltransferase complex protein AlgI
MLLGGLWHGASWNFVIWGAFHGLLLGIERGFGKKPLYFFLPKFLRIAVTYGLVLLAWVFFRADSFTLALDYLASMFAFGELPQTSLLIKGIIYSPYYLLALGSGAFVIWGMDQSWDWSRKLTPVKIATVLLALVVSVAVLSMQSYNPFIYFNF